MHTKNMTGKLFIAILLILFGVIITAYTYRIFTSNKNPINKSIVFKGFFLGIIFMVIGVILIFKSIL